MRLRTVGTKPDGFVLNHHDAAAVGGRYPLWTGVEKRSIGPHRIARFEEWVEQRRSWLG